MFTTSNGSALRDDAETNLITLCRECHQILHRS
jgi:predicted HNH restriction endonuclease